jgi:ethanolamine ammonia-lyase large subunit
MLGLAPAPEFAQWLESMGAMDERGSPKPLALPAAVLPLLAKA